MARPTKLKYVGRTEPVFDEKGKQTGEKPIDFYNGVPARDLKEEDLALLSDEDIKLIQSGENPLYVDPEKEKAKKERERAKVAKQNADNVKARDRKSAEKKSAPADAPTPDPNPVTPEPQPADGPSAEGASGEGG
jgi:hypothetical protein